MIKAIITDFDGTLVDTFTPNLKAYQRAFSDVGLTLTAEDYKKCFGFRFERFMAAMGISDNKICMAIKERKKEYYPQYFDYLRPNKALIDLIRSFKQMGGYTAIASTARRDNLLNALNYLDITDCFDLIYSAEDVTEGKPSPEIYNKTMEKLRVAPGDTLIFEDSEVGLQAAEASAANFLKVIF